MQRYYYIWHAALFMHMCVAVFLTGREGGLFTLKLASVPGLPHYVRVLICGGGDNVVKTWKDWAD